MTFCDGIELVHSLRLPDTKQIKLLKLCLFTDHHIIIKNILPPFTYSECKKPKILHDAFIWRYLSGVDLVSLFAGHGVLFSFKTSPYFGQ